MVFLIFKPSITLYLSIVRSVLECGLIVRWSLFQNICRKHKFNDVGYDEREKIKYILGVEHTVCLMLRRFLTRVIFLLTVRRRLIF